MLQRKLEREFVSYGGAPPATDSAPDDGCDEYNNEDEDGEPVASVSGNIIFPIHCFQTYTWCESMLDEHPSWIYYSTSLPYG